MPPKKTTASKRSRQPPPPPPTPFTPWDDSFPTESFNTIRGDPRWVVRDGNIIDTNAISADDITKHLTNARDALKSHGLSDDWLKYIGNAYLNTELKQSIQGAALLKGVLIVPIDEILPQIVENYDDFDTMCGKTFVETTEKSKIPLPNAVISKLGFHYLTRQFSKITKSKKDIEHYTRNIESHTTWVAISISHLPEIKMVGFIDTLPYTNEPFLTAFDIILNTKDTVHAPNVWSLVREWDSWGERAKNAQTKSLYVNYLCARSDLDGQKMKGIGKLLATWAFACEMGSYLGIVLEPVMGNYAKNPGDPCLGGPNMLVASLYHETFKFQRTFAIDERMIAQHKKWIKNGLTHVKDNRAKKAIEKYYNHVFDSYQHVFLTTQPPPFVREWHSGGEQILQDRIDDTGARDSDAGEDADAGAGAGAGAGARGGAGGGAGAGEVVDMSDREHLIAFAIMFRPYPTEHDLTTILARIIMS